MHYDKVVTKGTASKDGSYTVSMEYAYTQQHYDSGKTLTGNSTLTYTFKGPAETATLTECSVDTYDDPNSPHAPRVLEMVKISLEPEAPHTIVKPSDISLTLTIDGREPEEYFWASEEPESELAISVGWRDGKVYVTPISFPHGVTTRKATLYGSHYGDSYHGYSATGRFSLQNGKVNAVLDLTKIS